jgi:CDP-diacylglycerol--serine O-phosphatidyltransferase
MFGLKDVFTSLNVLGGVVAVCLCVDGRPFAAGIAIMLGYIGDLLDGWVARLTKSGNAFGAEYDSIADHLSHCIAPATIVYLVYQDAELGLSPRLTKLVAIALASVIILTGTIRHARNSVRPVQYPGVWVGLPRSVMGFMAIALANSPLFPLAPGGQWLGVLILPVLCVLCLSYVPYPNHRMLRKHTVFVRCMVGSFLVTTFSVLALAPTFMFDVLFFWMGGYTLGAWMALSGEERKIYRQAVKTALAEVSA